MLFTIMLRVLFAWNFSGISRRALLLVYYIIKYNIFETFTHYLLLKQNKYITYVYNI